MRAYRGGNDSCHSEHIFINLLHAHTHTKHISHRWVHGFCSNSFSLPGIHLAAVMNQLHAIKRARVNMISQKCHGHKLSVVFLLPCLVNRRAVCSIKQKTMLLFSHCDMSFLWSILCSFITFKLSQHDALHTPLCNPSPPWLKIDK